MDETFGLPGIEADGMAVSSVVKVARFSGAPNDGFLPNSLKTLFGLSRVFSHLQKCILSGAIKFLSIRSS